MADVDAAAEAPTKLIYPLEHAYTPAELSFAALKGADAAVAAVLVMARARPRTVRCTWPYCRSRSGGPPSTPGTTLPAGTTGPEDDEYEIIEVSERVATLSAWQRPEGGATELGPLPIEDAELCPPDALEELEPEELSFSEATGNEGASFERSYRRAALVLWPRRQGLAVLTQAGVQTTVPYLAELTTRWEESTGADAAALWAQAHELATHMVRQWPRPSLATAWTCPSAVPSGAPDAAATMLRLLTRLHDIATIDAFLTTVTAQGVYGPGENEAVLGALRLLGPERAATLLEQIVVANAPPALGACADLLARAATDSATENGPVDLRPAALAFVARLPGDPARAPDPAHLGAPRASTRPGRRDAQRPG